jgi:hypothetical protein
LQNAAYELILAEDSTYPANSEQREYGLLERLGFLAYQL